ncbi:PREDICTED: uncharacterized protein LOC109127538 [Camelina sativa]|uniref:Uncharacterized protein LOC109127538 n=1 Tax=Camelina sativa TaxID=90675 RepID=A0ABM1QMN3_CAMSA|nr:PREDICTED: uncharacterized protein LOC109127538 [Camelina sativa]
MAVQSCQSASFGIRTASPSQKLTSKPVAHINEAQTIFCTVNFVVCFESRSNSGKILRNSVPEYSLLSPIPHSLMNHQNLNLPHLKRRVDDSENISVSLNVETVKGKGEDGERMMQRTSLFL